jgi:LmbE family N-acetylglucosaminyl deacetylase
MREAELAAAAAVLGVRHTQLLSYPDGALAGVALRELVADVQTAVTNDRPSHLAVFDEGGVTGHPDHVRATEAAARAAEDLPVLAWTIPDTVAEALNTEFGTTFRGRPATEIDWTLTVDRTRQWRASWTVSVVTGRGIVSLLAQRDTSTVPAGVSNILLPPTAADSAQGPGNAGRSAVSRCPRPAHCGERA